MHSCWVEGLLVLNENWCTEFASVFSGRHLTLNSLHLPELRSIDLTNPLSNYALLCYWAGSSEMRDAMNVTSWLLLQATTTNNKRNCNTETAERTTERSKMEDRERRGFFLLAKNEKSWREHEFHEYWIHVIRDVHKEIQLGAKSENFPFERQFESSPSRILIFDLSLACF